jgi:hypothetical protein
LTESRQQDRPTRRALSLLCTAFTCLVLLVSVLSAPPAHGGPSKLIRYGTQDTAHPFALEDVECRKRAVAGKASPLRGLDADPQCLPPQAIFDGPSGDTGVAAALPKVRPARASTQTLGARAPPEASA